MLGGETGGAGVFPATRCSSGLEEGHNCYHEWSSYEWARSDL